MECLWLVEFEVWLVEVRGGLPKSKDCRPSQDEEQILLDISHISA